MLKGGHLLTVWSGDLVRSTADVDLHCNREMDQTEVEAAIGAAAAIRLDDGTYFDSKRLTFASNTAGRPGGVSPKGPHTHLLPARLSVGNDLPPGLQIPAGYLTYAIHYPEPQQGSG